MFEVKKKGSTEGEAGPSDDGADELQELQLPSQQTAAVAAAQRAGRTLVSEMDGDGPLCTTAATEAAPADGDATTAAAAAVAASDQGSKKKKRLRDGVTSHKRRGQDDGPSAAAPANAPGAQTTTKKSRSADLL